ncbi:hypothetical protein EJ06DRAFT_534451 [Trichodelitschia bisporula]|uniref:Coatomer subunit delta n=1 Tax=Trichodelitschia bisporula TaxID=703511 RepID=A0A6G1HJJ0_9PEZI|nr:hypothetical protein EJ06DRAFT_534451 [Trichodelitschia bisporula]
MILSASVCTRGGKVVVSRTFVEMQRSRIEALLAQFPKLAASGTQHTTVEVDAVRYVYQPLDELFLVLITNRASNILQDIDSLHLFAQVVSSICKTLDEREIVKHAFELLGAFDELVTLGYRENLTLSQIKTFLEMESHEERIQEIIARNKELEATEERKRKAKQLEMQRKEMARSTRGIPPRAPSYPTYTPPATTNIPDTYDAYKAEQKGSKPLAVRGKGMQLGKKSKTTSAFDQIRGELGPEETAPLVPAAPSPKAATHVSQSVVPDREPIHIALVEAISARLSRDGTLESLDVKGEVQLRITDPSLVGVKLRLGVGNTRGAQLMANPNIDKTMFKNQKVIQVPEGGKAFPANQSITAMRWKVALKEVDDLPITFSVWLNDAGGNTWNVTVEYEWTGGDPLKDVVVTIPFATSEPVVSSFDAVYEVSGDSLDWTIGTVDDSNSTGSFEFEAHASDESELFPMAVRFNKTRPFVEVDVESVTLVSMGEEVDFSKEVKSRADNYKIY